jgi:hypothetical protein
MFEPSFSQHTPWSQREYSNPFFSDGLICICGCVLLCALNMIRYKDSTNFKWLLYTSYTEQLNQRKLLGLFCFPSLCVTVHEIHLTLFFRLHIPPFWHHWSEFFTVGDTVSLFSPVRQHIWWVWSEYEEQHGHWGSFIHLIALWSVADKKSGMFWKW